MVKVSSRAGCINIVLLGIILTEQSIKLLNQGINKRNQLNRQIRASNILCNHMDREFAGSFQNLPFFARLIPLGFRLGYVLVNVGLEILVELLIVISRHLHKLA